MDPQPATETSKPQPSEHSNPMKTVLAWVAGISAILGLLATLAGGVRWLASHHQESAEVKSAMALAASQQQQGEYSSAIATYQGVLQKDPNNHRAADEELTAAMLWLQNFHAIEADGKPPETVAAANLDTLFPILDAARVRTQGTRSADVLAHIGWAHWLNEKIAQREFGDIDEKNLRAALAIDAHNVYANAMLGNIMLQANENFDEAIAHLNTAAATGRERPLVRSMQLGALVYLDTLKGRAELARAVNDMRKNNEPLDDGEKHRIVGWACNPIVTSREERDAFLSAVPPADALATYQWLSHAESEDSWKTMQAELIQANILELTGKPSDALAKYTELQKQFTPSTSFTLRNEVSAAIKRLGKPS